MKISIVIAALGILFAAQASAADYGIQVHGVSHHFSKRNLPSGENWNEQNFGVAFVRYADDISYQIGAYKNSLSTSQASFYARYAIVNYTLFERRGEHTYKLGAFAGVVDGYPLIKHWRDSSVRSVQKTGVAPALGLFARVDLQDTNITARLTPKRTSSRAQGSAVVSVEGGISF